ncbi:MAG TPA: cytochrome c maturation protein CcmE [Candidatus Thermoplasmatota archaeon]|nr:cytochrome c maturation protein CcmE [Candidatus Thermoplasmatota archaeon]
MNKQAKILLVLALAAAGTAIAFVGSLDEGFKSVSEIVQEAPDYEGRHVELKATIVPGSLNRTADDHFTFQITDDKTELSVLWTKPIPNHEAGGSIDGRTVTIKGFLQADPHKGYVFHAEDMVVGCASKYEEKNTTATGDAAQAAA